MADPRHDDDAPVLALADFEALFADEEGVDQVLAAVSWLERADRGLRGASELARAMEETVRNAPLYLAEDLGALISDCVAARAEGDPDLEETATVDAWDLLVLRDRLEDLRGSAPELFDDAAVVALAEFDEALDRADIWLGELDDARVQMGVERGTGDRRWWRPRADFGSGEWDLPAEAHPDNWVPDDEEIAGWHKGELAPLRAAAVSRYVAGLSGLVDVPVIRGTGAGTSGGSAPADTEPPVGLLEDKRALGPGLVVRFMSLDAALDTLRVDLDADVAGVTLVAADGEHHALRRHTARVWWLGGLGRAALDGARLIAFHADGAVFADAALGSLPVTTDS